MTNVTLSSKNQITLPVEMVRALSLRQGDKLVAELIDNHIVLLPKPESWVDYFEGSMKGVYGSTKGEIDRYIAEVRYGWDIGALRDALALDSQLRDVYDATSSTEARSPSHIAERLGVDLGLVSKKLEELERLDTVKPLEHPVNKAEHYYRRIP